MPAISHNCRRCCDGLSGVVSVRWCPKLEAGGRAFRLDKPFIVASRGGLSSPKWPWWAFLGVAVVFDEAGGFGFNS